jgi:hypothetical protein
MLKQISREQYLHAAEAFDQDADRVVLSVEKTEYLAKTSDGKYWHVQGVNGAKQLFRLYGVF